jgi:hypothetical protein
VPQQIEQRIPANLEAGLSQGWGEQMMELPGAQPWLPQALLTHQFQHPLTPSLPLRLAAKPLVVSLSADPHVMASPGHAQAFDGSLREDLPKGFFTTRTP